MMSLINGLHSEFRLTSNTLSSTVGNIPTPLRVKSLLNVKFL